MLLFSIPVHEKPKVIENQIQNFQKYNPSCAIVLHVSLDMPQSDWLELQQLVNQYPEVFINSKRYFSGWGDGSLFKIHLSNFRFAVEKNIPFSHVCLHASNDMFVSKGLEQWIQNTEAGFDTLRKGHDNPVYRQTDHFRKDLSSRNIKRKLNLSLDLGSQIEGSFYSKEIVQKMISATDEDNFWELPLIFSAGIHSKKSWRFFIFKWVERILRHSHFPIQIMLYCREEVLLPSIASKFISTTPRFNYCYINWKNKLSVSTEEIDWISTQNTEALLHQIGMSDLNSESNQINFFAIKRIDRNLEDPFRKYISQL